MKNLGFVMMAMVSLCALGADEYEFVTGKYQILADKQNYIQINEDLDSFTVNMDFGSIGGSGSVGYYVYDGSIGTVELLSKVSESRREGNLVNKQQGGSLTISNLSAGDKIGFYLVRNNGVVYTDWRFVESAGGVSGISFNRLLAKDEILTFGDIVVVSHGQGAQTSGMPLPGFLPALLIGGVGLGGLSLRRFRRPKA